MWGYTLFSNPDLRRVKICCPCISGNFNPLAEISRFALTPSHSRLALRDFLSCSLGVNKTPKHSVRGRRTYMDSHNPMPEEDVSKIAAASSAAADRIHNLLNAPDVDTLKRQQFLILGRLQDSNAVLAHFNDFSERSFVAVANDFSQNTRLLKNLIGDLDHVFRKIGSLKTRIRKVSADAFNDAVADNRPDLDVCK